MDGESRGTVNFTRVDEIELKPVSWLVDGWLVENTLAGLVGPSGSCKSFLALDWACRVATGVPWYGRDVKQGAVFYLAGEGRQGLRKRVAGWEGNTGTRLAGMPLYVADWLPGLCDDFNAAEVVASIERVAESAFFASGCDPALIVIDTVARAMAGNDENSATDVGKFIETLDWLRTRWGCCVLSVHHTGHGADNQTRARGSSAYRAALDSEFVVKATVDAVTVSGSKAKDWTQPLPLNLSRHIVPITVPGPDGLPMQETTLVLRDGSGMVLELGKREQALDLHSKGVPLRDIAARIGIGKSTVQRWTACPTTFEANP